MLDKSRDTIPLQFKPALFTPVYVITGISLKRWIKISDHRKQMFKYSEVSLIIMLKIHLVTLSSRKIEKNINTNFTLSNKASFFI